jgi:hypothetical protein
MGSKQDKDTPPDWVAVVPAGTAEDGLARTLDALGEQKRPPREVLVVGSLALGPALKERTGVRLIRTGDAQPVAGQINAGLSAAHGAFVAVAAPGCRPEPGALDRMLETLSADDELGAVSARVRRKLAPATLGTALRTILPAPPPPSRREPAGLGGCCDLFRAQTLADTGLLEDAAFPLVGWETDLAARMREAGYGVKGTEAAATMDAPPPGTSSLSPARVALETGRAAARNRARHKTDSHRAPLFLLVLLSAASLIAGAFGIGYAMAGFLLVFIVGFFHSVREPLRGMHIPGAVLHFALWATAVLLTRRTGPVGAWTQMHWPTVHPAIFRQYLFVGSGAVFYGLVLALCSLWTAIRAWRLGLPVLRVPAAFLSAVGCHLLTGLGYLEATVSDLFGSPS